MAMRRALCIWLLTALLAVAILPQAGLAISAQEALFGDGTADDDTSTENYAGPETGTNGRYPTLKLGDSDSADGVAYIVFMQNRLIELGYLNDDADGTYGANTEVAVREFQKNNNLQATGIADPYTQEMLYSGNVIYATQDVGWVVASYLSQIDSANIYRWAEPAP